MKIPKKMCQNVHQTDWDNLQDIKNNKIINTILPNSKYIPNVDIDKILKTILPGLKCISNITRSQMIIVNKVLKSDV